MQLVHSLQVKHELACTICIAVLTKYSSTYFPHINVTKTQITDNEHLNSISQMMSSSSLCMFKIFITDSGNGSIQPHHHAFSYHDCVSIKVISKVPNFGRSCYGCGLPLQLIIVDTCITCTITLLWL